MFSILSCSGGEMEEKNIKYNSLNEVTKSGWARLSEKKIYFGHQSVGYNIIDGVMDWIKQYPVIKLNIVESNEAKKNIDDGVFIHSKVGKNTDPESKINEFREVLDHGVGEKVNAAMLKFCYVDIKKDTDINSIFNVYKDEVTKIKKKYPHISIIHSTVPLTQRKTGFIAFVKKLLGRDNGSIDDNIKRNEYNKLLLEEFKGKDLIFDIAKIESTYSDGTSCSFKKDGKTYYSLIPDYTYDGGHLNETGRKIVAEKLILLMVGL